MLKLETGSILFALTLTCLLGWGRGSYLLAADAVKQEVEPAAKTKQDKYEQFLVIAPPARIVIAAQDNFKKVWDQKQFSHDLLDAVLKKYVGQDALVDYVGLRKAPDALNEYLFRLQQVDLNNLPSRDARMALWINAYNACTLKLMITMLPGDQKKSKRFSLVTTQPSAWKTTLFKVAGQEITLDKMENGVLRKAPYLDPRVHAAVNCASMSCPKLQRSAFTEKNLDQLLEASATDWVNDTSKNRMQGRILFLSKIFKWYPKDFEAGGGPVAFIKKYLKDKTQKATLKDRDKLDVKYLEYSWMMNGK